MNVIKVTDALRLKKIWGLFLLFTLYLSGNLDAQTKQLISQGLKIGDTLPEILWHMPLQVVNDPQRKKITTLNDYRRKLIIIDFWSTWCTPCIQNFPKLHALQNEFGNQIKILTVTEQDKNKIDLFFKSGVGKGYDYINSIVNDSILSKYFPHNGIPHFVWIDTQGRLLNTTQSDQITSANIQGILNNQETQMISKIDLSHDSPLFLSQLFSKSLELKSYSIFARGYYPGLSSGPYYKMNSEGKIYAMQFTNVPMMDIYYPVLLQLFKKRNDMYNLSRTIIEVKRPALLNLIEKTDGSFEKYNQYNYELIVPESQTDSLYEFILSDLNRYSDYIGRIENKLVDCLVLIRTSTIDKIKSRGGKRKCTFPSTPSILINNKLSVMINMLSEGTPIKLPIVDETGYTGNVDIEISGILNLNGFRKELNKYDLDLIPTKRSINMFVLKDK